MQRITGADIPVKSVKSCRQSARYGLHGNIVAKENKHVGSRHALTQHYHGARSLSPYRLHLLPFRVRTVDGILASGYIRGCNSGMGDVRRGAHYELLCAHGEGNVAHTHQVKRRILVFAVGHSLCRRNGLAIQMGCA